MVKANGCRSLLGRTQGGHHSMLGTRNGAMSGEPSYSHRIDAGERRKQGQCLSTRAKPSVYLLFLAYTSTYDEAEKLIRKGQHRDCVLSIPSCPPRPCSMSISALTLTKSEYLVSS